MNWILLLIKRKFFPRFRKHRKILEEIGIQERGMIANIDREKHSKKDVKRMIEEISKLRQNRIELEAEFVLSLDDVLAPDQMIRLGVYKQKMMNEMREEIQGGKGKKGDLIKKDRKRRNRGLLNQSITDFEIKRMDLSKSLAQDYNNLFCIFNL